MGRERDRDPWLHNRGEARIELRIKACKHLDKFPAPCDECNDCERFASHKLEVSERLRLILGLCKQRKDDPLIEDIKQVAKGRMPDAQRTLW